MDPLTHSLVGAALARSRLVRGLPLATLALVVAANVPDIDSVAYLGGGDAALWWRRGLSHGPLGLLVLPAGVWTACLVLGWLLRLPSMSIAQRKSLLAFAYLATLTHPALDWLNTYGVRLLSPFDSRWFYGDTLFIIDPWLWLLLGAGVYLDGSSQLRRQARWAALALVASLPPLFVPVAAPARILWIAGLAVLAMLGRGLPTSPSPTQRERRAVVALAGAGCYLVAMLVSGVVGRSLVAADAARLAGEPVGRVMVAPAAVDPFVRDVVVETAAGYRAGTFRWIGSPRLELEPRVFERAEADPLVRRVWSDPRVRGFTHWARFPCAQVAVEGDAAVVSLYDIRYSQRPGSGFSKAVLVVPTGAVTGD